MDDTILPQPDPKSPQESMANSTPPQSSPARILEIIDLLKQCKQNGMNYHDAAQCVQGKGFTTEEIDQASYQFSYTNIPPSGVMNPLDDENKGMDVQSANEIAMEEDKEQDQLNSFIRYIPFIGGFGRFRGK